MTDWEKLLTTATSGVQEVCESVLSGGERDKRIGVGAAGDETLVADREAERVIMNSLLSLDDVRMLSEEVGEKGPKSSRFLAVVDPLDGSSNFSRGIPFYCTSVCIVEGRRLREARFALVRNLVNGDLYYAEKGAGAFKNGIRLRPSATTELSDSVAAVDLSKAKPAVIQALVPLSSKVGRQVHFGANALEMCMVADGEVDSFIDLRGRMRVTDVAGAYLVAKEAGIMITSETGDELDPPLDLKSRLSVVASANGVLHEKVLKELSRFTERRP
jgi:myo-inositol-1(or 4)-monophosphatase